MGSSLLKSLFKLGWIATTSVSLLAFLSPLAPLFEIASHLRILYAVILAVLFVVALVARQKVVALIIGLVSIINLQPILGLYTRAATPQGLEYQIPIKIVEYNPDAYDNHDYQKYFDYIKKQQADIVIITELDQGWYDTLKKEMPAIGYGHSAIAYKDNCGLAVFSQSQIASVKETVVNSTLKHPNLEVTFEVPCQFKLFAVHASTPQYLQDRNDEFHELSKRTRTQTVPIIMAGDFNCSPWSEDFMQIVRFGKVKNASQSFGPLCTWNARWMIPIIPIDHMFINDQVKTTEMHTGNDLGSDHLPLVGQFELP